PEGIGDSPGVGLEFGSGLGLELGAGLGPTPEGEGEGAAAVPLGPPPLTLASQLTPEPANGSQAGGPPVSQTSVPGPRPNTKMASRQATKSPKMMPNRRRSLPCIRVRSG